MKAERVAVWGLCALFVAALAWRIASIDFGRIATAATSASDEGRPWFEPTLSLLDWKSLPPRSVAYRIERPPQISPTERIIVSAVDFAMLPNALVVAEDDARCSDFDFVIAHRHSKHLQGLVDGFGFRKVNESREVCLLARADMEYEPPNETTPAASPVRRFRPGLALAAFVAFVVLAAMAMKTPCASPAWTLLFVGVMSVVCLSATLPHTLISPNGTAVYAGKARLLLACGGCPPGFFVDKDWSVFQPAYPIGLTALTALFYLISGDCGNWLVQLVPFAGVALSLWFVFCRVRTAAGRMLVLLLALSATTHTLCRGFYAEGWMAMFLLLGCWRIVAGRTGFVAWFLLGLAGGFKNEGFLFYVAMATTLVICGRRETCRLQWVLGGMLLPAVWQAYAWHAGGGVDGFEWPGVFVFLSQAWAAAVLTVRCMCIELDSGMWLIPLAITTSAVGAWRRNRRLSSHEKAGIVFTVASLALVFCVYGCCDPETFDWHLDSSIRRLLWTPMVFAEICYTFRHESRCQGAEDARAAHGRADDLRPVRAGDFR